VTGRARPRPRLGDGQAGITVLEMTVVVALLAIVLAVAFEGLVAFQRATAGVDARQQNLEEARTIMAVVTRDLRTATSFSSLAASDVTFLGNLDIGATAPPNRLRLYVDGQGRLAEAVTPPDDPTANPVTYTGAPTLRVVGGPQVATGSLFDFRDGGDNPTTDPAAVASVVIDLSVSVPAGVPVPPTVLSSRVFLPNIAAAGSGA
jgi:type II secretory pathway pseudopilin PulG